MQNMNPQAKNGGWTIRRRMMMIAAAIALLLCAAALAAFLLWQARAGRALAAQTDPDASAAPAQTAQVMRGDIAEAVYAAGSAQPRSQPGVYAKVSATVESARVAMGDAVKAGDVLMTLSSESMQSEAAQLEIDLSQAQTDVEDVETYERYLYRQLYYENGRPRMDVDTGEPLMEKYSNELSIRAPGAGRVVAVYIEPGDDALAVYREKGAVMVISTDGMSSVTLTGVEPGLLALNGEVRITGEGIDATGRVQALARRGMDATLIVQGDTWGLDVPVSVSLPDGTGVGEGTLTVNRPLMVSAYGGTINSLLVREGSIVEDDQVLAKFTWNSWPLYIDNASALLDYSMAQASLEALREKMDALTVTAPCDGTVASVDVQPGDEVEDGALLLSIVEDAGMAITLTVDELDIPRVQKGQTVTMTVDALPDVTLAGTVEKIAPLGNTQTSVTTYDVTVRANAVDERVKGGMNVSGEITTGGAADALLIPTDALQKDADGYFVTMTDGETRRIQTGIMTDEMTQVTDGLQEGETVLY